MQLKALEKQEASLKKERATMNDEQRKRLLIAEQIERAEREVEKAHPQKGLQRRSGARRARRRLFFRYPRNLPSLVIDGSV